MNLIKLGKSIIVFGLFFPFSIFSAEGIQQSAAPTRLSGDLFLYCAAGMRPAVDELATNFENIYHVKMEISYDGSNKLLGQIDLTRRGDIYISGDGDYIAQAGIKGFVASKKTLCWFIPVIMVQKGNPRGIRTLPDMLAPHIRIGQGDEKSAAVGRVTMRLLLKNGIDTLRWQTNLLLVTPTVNELANAIKLKTIDAAIVWNAVAVNYKSDADVVPIDSALNVVTQVDAAVLSFSANRKEAQAFLEYAVSDSGCKILTRNGYTVEKP